MWHCKNLFLDPEKTGKGPAKTNTHDGHIDNNIPDVPCWISEIFIGEKPTSNIVIFQYFCPLKKIGNVSQKN